MDMCKIFYPALDLISFHGVSNSFRYNDSETEIIIHLYLELNEIKVLSS